MSDAFWDRMLSDHLEEYHRDKYAKNYCVVCGAECDEEYCSTDCEDTYE